MTPNSSTDVTHVDPWGAGHIAQVETMTLYTLTRAGNLSNGNAADAAGAAMLLLEPGQQAAAMGAATVRHPPHSSPQSDPHSPSLPQGDA